MFVFVSLPWGTSAPWEKSLLSMIFISAYHHTRQAHGRFSVKILSEWSVCVCVCVCALCSVLSLFYPMDCSLPGSSVHGILQARILNWVAIFSSKGFFQLRDQAYAFCIFCIGKQILYHWAIWEARGECTNRNKHIYAIMMASPTR